MNVTVSKEWKDTANNSVSTNKTATFTLHQVSYTALTVRVLGKTANDDGSVTVNIKDDGKLVKQVTLDRTNNWNYVLSPLVDGQNNYTVEVANSTVGDATLDTTTFSGSAGGTATITTGLGGPTLQVRVQGLQETNTASIAVNIFRSSDNRYVGTMGVSKAKFNWVRTNKDATTAFQLDASESYYAQIGSFDVNLTDESKSIGNAVVQSGSPATFTSDNDTKEIVINATQGRPTLHIVADGLANTEAGNNQNAFINVTITPHNASGNNNPRDTTPIPVQLNASNQWQYDYYMDGVAGTTYTVSV